MTFTVEGLINLIGIFEQPNLSKYFSHFGVNKWCDRRGGDYRAFIPFCEA